MKKVVIIGSTSGIGYELARQMIQKGYQVAGCGRREEILQKMEKELAPNFIGQQLDIRVTMTSFLNWVVWIFALYLPVSVNLIRIWNGNWKRMYLKLISLVLQP